MMQCRSMEPVATPLATAARPARPLGLVAVAGAALVWGLSAVIIKLVSTTGLVASVYRLWLAVPFLWAAPVFVPALRRRLDRPWLAASVVGGALFALHQVLFFTSLKLTSVATVSIIGALQPALVLGVAGPWFGERPSPRAIVWSLVAIGGAGVVVWGSAGTPAWSAWGDALAVANLFAFTAYFLASKQARHGVGAVEYLVGMTTVAALIVLAVAVATGEELGSPRGRDWPLLLFLALVPGTLGHFLANWAHPHVPALVVSVMLLGVPVVAAVGAAVFLGEALTLAQAAGGAIVLVAIGIVMRERPAASAEALAAGAPAPGVR